MRKAPLYVTLGLSVCLLLPVVGQAAGSIEQINQQINKMKQEQKATESKVNQLDKQMEAVHNKQEQVKDDIASIDARLNETQEKIQALDKQITASTEMAREAGKELDIATKRVQERDQLLKKRVKVMYEMGDVSYLDVLLGANDFMDLLSRLDAINMIVKSDTNILESNVKDRALVAQKKKEIDEHLGKLQVYFQESTKLKAQLGKVKQERHHMLQALVQQEGHLEEIKAEHEQEMLQLVDRLKKAQAEKRALQQAQQAAAGGTAVASRKYSGGRFAWPVPDSNRITSNFGYRSDPFTGKQTGHNGMDIGAAQGTSIVAAADGVVIVSGYVRGYGNCIIIDHGGDLTSLYGHIREGGLMVSEGQEVKRGQKIAEVGSTGRSTGPHLHFGVYQGQSAVDPVGYLR